MSGFTDIDRIVEQIEEIPWSPNYLYRSKADFINFVKRMDYGDQEIISDLRNEINELSEDCESSDRIIESLQEDIELLNEDYLKLDEELEELKLKING